MTGSMGHGPAHPWYTMHDGVVTMTIPERLTRPDLRQALLAMREWLLNDVDRPYALVVSIERLSLIASADRLLISEFEAGYRHVERRFSAGHAYVVRSAVIQSVVNVIYWRTPPPYEYAFFATEEPAMQWARADLAKALEDFPQGAYWARRGSLSA